MRLALLLILLATSACNHLRVQRGESTPRPVASTHEYKLNSFLWGFVPGPRLQPESILCPGGRIESLDLRMSGTDVLLTAVTVGIFVPHRVTVGCSKTVSTNL
jgi:hypothetical protein